MKRLTLLAILLLFTVTAFAQVYDPWWQQITEKIWARTEIATYQTYGDIMSSILSFRGAVQYDNKRRLDNALLEIRAQNPDAFDQVFQKYHLALDTR